MNRYIKYFENWGKNMSFLIKDEEMLDKYKQIWDVIKNKLSIKFHSKPIYDETYIKVKVRELDCKLEQTLWEMMCQKKIYIINVLLVILLIRYENE